MDRDNILFIKTSKLMALTYWNDNNAGGDGNLTFETQYYEADRQTVTQQNGAAASGLVNFIFRNEEITVFAARDNQDQILELVALPCPPYHHLVMAEAQPGNVLYDF